ncbi:MAG: helix-turn-helix transcriptional regulator [Clostridia bacterium]|nr:helix-turn-helix transcriptional regulator [Clostridia bacterium]
MVNVSKIKSLAKLKGITIAFICSSVGMQRGYLNDVAAGKTNMPEDRIRTIAEILDTSYEYLTDQTDDPIGPEAKQSLEMFDLLADPANPIANRFTPEEMRDIVFEVTPDQLAEYITASRLQTKKAPDNDAEDLQRKIFDKVLGMHDKTKLEAVLKMLEVMG